MQITIKNSLFQANENTAVMMVKDTCKSLNKIRSLTYFELKRNELRNRIQVHN